MNTRNQDHQQQQEQQPALASSKAWVEGRNEGQLKATRPTTPEQLRQARMDNHQGSNDYLTADDGLTAVVLASKNYPCAYGYRRRSMNPVFRYQFNDDAHREAFVSDWMKNANNAIAAKNAAKAAQRTRHTLAVGDVLYTSWGYEQTNVDFYEVIAVRGAAVDLVKLKQQRNESAIGMQGTCRAVPGAHVGEPIKGKRPNGHNSVRVDSCITAYPWDGRDLSWSSYH